MTSPAAHWSLSLISSQCWSECRSYWARVLLVKLREVYVLLPNFPNFLCIDVYVCITLCVYIHILAICMYMYFSLSRACARSLFRALPCALAHTHSCARTILNISHTLGQAGEIGPWRKIGWFLLSNLQRKLALHRWEQPPFRLLLCLHFAHAFCRLDEGCVLLRLCTEHDACIVFFPLIMATDRHRAANGYAAVGY